MTNMDYESAKMVGESLARTVKNIQPYFKTLSLLVCSAVGLVIFVHYWNV